MPRTQGPGHENQGTAIPLNQGSALACIECLCKFG